MKIKQSIMINAPLDRVYNAFYDLNTWQSILPDVSQVDVIYDDGLHQEFTMAVTRPNGEEMIRGIRFCKLNRSLDLFQPIPPPNVERMWGVWRFEQISGSTQVNVEREFTLHTDKFDFDDLNRAQLQFAGMLEHYLQTNLNYFKEALEHDRDNHNQPTAQ